MTSEKQNLFESFKNELAEYWDKRFSSLKVGSAELKPFHSKALEDPDKVNAEATAVVQEMANTAGAPPPVLIAPQNMMYTLLASCRSEKSAEATRIRCMAAAVNEAEIFKNTIVKKLDALKQ